MRYEYLMTNGSKVDIWTDERLTLKQLQGLVGGLIEFAPEGDFYGVPKGLSACCNEEGRLIELPRNPHFNGQETIVGNVVLGRDDEEGNFNGIE